MAVESVSNTNSSVVGAAERDYSQISKIDFMTLLVAQIQNQDPMSPMDNTEFTSQITQFTQLEQLETLGDKLDENIVIGQSINNTAMLSLVGKDVTVEGDKVWMEDGRTSETVLACGAAGEATIEVTDESGNVRGDLHQGRRRRTERRDLGRVDRRRSGARRNLHGLGHRRGRRRRTWNVRP